MYVECLFEVSNSALQKLSFFIETCDTKKSAKFTRLAQQHGVLMKHNTHSVIMNQRDVIDKHTGSGVREEKRDEHEEEEEEEGQHDDDAARAVVDHPVKKTHKASPSTSTSDTALASSSSSSSKSTTRRSTTSLLRSTAASTAIARSIYLGQLQSDELACTQQLHIPISFIRRKEHGYMRRTFALKSAQTASASARVKAAQQYAEQNPNSLKMSQAEMEELIDAERRGDDSVANDASTPSITIEFLLRPVFSSMHGVGSTSSYTSFLDEKEEDPHGNKWKENWMLINAQKTNDASSASTD